MRQTYINSICTYTLQTCFVRAAVSYPHSSGANTKVSLSGLYRYVKLRKQAV